MKTTNDYKKKKQSMLKHGVRVANDEVIGVLIFFKASRIQMTYVKWKYIGEMGEIWTMGGIWNAPFEENSTAWVSSN